MYITFEEAIKEYKKYLLLKRKNSSIRSINNRIDNYILPYFKNKNIYDFKKTDYINWQIEIEKKGFKYSYKSTLHTCFVTFLNYCILFYDLSENIASKVGNFKNDSIENNTGQIWTIEEFNRFISVIDNLIYKTLFEFIFYTGMRKGEALALTWEDIDFFSNKVNINKTATRFFDNNGNRIMNNPKTQNSIRTIYIDDVLIHKLKLLKELYQNKYYNFNDSYFVFGGKKILAFTTVDRKKDYYCKLANVKKIKIHELRHSHACLLFMNDVPIDEISYRLGHSKISMTTDIYLKYLPKNEKRVVQTLDKIHKNGFNTPKNSIFSHFKHQIWWRMRDSNP